MLNKIVVMLVLLSSTVGCVTVRDYDAEKLEYEQAAKIKKAQADPFGSEPTPDYVKVADNGEVFVDVKKSTPIINNQGIKLESWIASAKNNTTEPKCVRIDWKLMDFNLETALPYEFLIMGNEQLKIGKMTQTIWSFSDVAIALPPSGYVDKFNVRDAEIEVKTKKFTCEMTENEIQTPGQNDQN
jgi:hypothetical protein